MEPLSVLENRKKSSIVRINRNSKIFKTIIKAIQEKKGTNIVSIDLRKVHESVSDFFILCEASNPQQIRSIGQFVEEKVKELCNENPYKHEGYQALQWVLIDYVNIVVHIMQPESRKFYKIEEMWQDGDFKEHND